MKTALLLSRKGLYRYYEGTSAPVGSGANSTQAAGNKPEADSIHYNLTSGHGENKQMFGDRAGGSGHR